MKHFKIGNRILALLMTALMMFGGSTSAFAAESASNYAVKSASEDSEIMPLDAQYWTNDIKPGSSEHNKSIIRIKHSKTNKAPIGASVQYTRILYILRLSNICIF